MHTPSFAPKMPSKMNLEIMKPEIFIKSSREMEKKNTSSSNLHC